MEGKEIGSYIDRTYRAVRQDLTTRFRTAGVDLTPEQWVILSKLEHKKELGQSELANSTFKDKPTVSRILDLMVNKGFVIRETHQGDKRKFVIRLTPFGETLIRQATPIVHQSRMIGGNGISDDDYKNLIRVLDRIFENYRGE